MSTRTYISAIDEIILLPCKDPHYVKRSAHAPIVVHVLNYIIA